jgi:hypothetical protein
LPGGDGEAFGGVGGEAVDETADGPEAGLGGGEADAEASVFDVLGHVPEGGHLLVLVLEAVSRDLAGQVDFLFLGDLGLGRDDLAEPLDDVADDLADAGLGDLPFVGLGVGGAAGDVDGVVDFEVALRWREFSGGVGHWVSPWKIEEPKNQKRRL